MKLLKGRKLLERPKQLESRRGKFWRKFRSFLAAVKRRKMHIFNLVVLLFTAGYAVKYLINREEAIIQEEMEQQETEKAGDRLRDIFFNSVYEEETREQREREEAEERRKASIAAATLEPEQAVDEQPSEENETDGGEDQESLEEAAVNEEPVIIDAMEVLDKINKDKVADFPIYENKSYQYTIKYPIGWYLDKETGASSWLAYITSYDPSGRSRGDLPQAPRLEIFVQENIRSMSLDDWMQEGYKYYGEPTSSEKIQVAGAEAYRNTETNPYPAVVVTLIRGEYIYTLTYAGGDITSEDNIKLFDFMLNNFNIQ